MGVFIYFIVKLSRNYVMLIFSWKDFENTEGRYDYKALCKSYFKLVPHKQDATLYSWVEIVKKIKHPEKYHPKRELFQVPEISKYMEI